jgi:polysaccharide export outer membrane protein
MITRNVSLLIFIVIISISCGSTKKTAYFSQQGAAEITSSSEAPRPMIEINDLLSITVTSLSAQASSEFNIPNSIGFTSVSYSSSVAPVSGYLVGPDGYIKFPKLGRIKAVDLTPNELEDKLTEMLLQEGSLQKPIVTVRHLNFKVTVLGEVAKPSVFNIPNARISLLEAIGMAGDMTIYGRRDNVLLIREENKKKITVRINLNSSDLFQSPYYYLKSNDVVYVEPNNSRVSGASKSREIIPIVFSALSFLVIGVDILRR